MTDSVTSLVTRGTKTAARPVSSNGVIFSCYHVGVLTYEWRDDEGRAQVWRNRHRGDGGTYSVRVDGVMVSVRSQSLTNAVRLAGKTIKRTVAKPALTGAEESNS